VERWHRTVKVEFQGKCKDFDEFKIRWPNYFAEYNSKSAHWELGIMSPVALYFADFISPEELSSFINAYKAPDNTKTAED
jgi:hypothetical protein